MHYFSAEAPGKTGPRNYTYIFKENTFVFTTDIGVFSHGKMDGHTDLLLRSLPALQGSLLDMGCGNGCIGVILAKTYGLAVVQADVNPRALRLTRENAKKNGVDTTALLSDAYENIQGWFDTIIINPPIHAGKKVVFGLYEGALSHLAPQGKLYVVIHKKHGAESAIARLIEIFGNCQILHRKKGCYILCCTNSG